MKITKLLFLLIAALLAPATAFGQESQGPTLKEVNVFYMFIGPDGGSSEVLPLKRKVPAAEPLFPAIAAMLESPTEAEQKLGYISAAYGDMKLESVKLKKGQARVDFSRVIRPDYNPGDLQTLDFEEAVIKTAKQFSSVKKVIVCVNGINEFGIGLVVGRPYPCPKAK